MPRAARTPDGRNLAVEHAGDPADRVVLVHGWTPNARHLYGHRVADAAERGLRLIGYDRPGSGGCPGTRPTPATTAAGAASQVRRRKLDPAARARANIVLLRRVRFPAVTVSGLEIIAESGRASTAPTRGASVPRSRGSAHRCACDRIGGRQQARERPNAIWSGSSSDVTTPPSIARRGSVVARYSERN